MRIFTFVPSTILTASLIAACAPQEDTQLGGASLSISAGLHVSTGLQLQLPAGDYELEGTAEAVASSDPASRGELQMRLRALTATEDIAHESSFLIPLRSDAEIGDRWEGRAPLSITAGQIFDMLLTLHRAGQGPQTHTDISVGLNDAPHILSVSVGPSFVTPRDLQQWTVVAFDPDADNDRLTTIIELDGVQTELDLVDFDDDRARFAGATTAPAASGDYSARIIVTDGDGGTTEDSKDVLVALGYNRNCRDPREGNGSGQQPCVRSSFCRAHCGDSQWYCSSQSGYCQHPDYD